MQVILFEDPSVDDLRPITLFRPAYKITMGGLDLEKMFRDSGFDPCFIVRPYLEPLVKLETGNEPPVDKEVLFVNASMVPRLADLEWLLEMCGKKDRFCVIQKPDKGNDRVVVSYFPDKAVQIQGLNPGNISDYLLDDNPPAADHKLLLLSRPYEPVKYNMEIITDNLERMLDRYERLQDGVYVGRNVELADHVGLETGEGPVIIDDNTVVCDFAILRGPVYLGRNVRVNEYAVIKDECSIRDTIKIGGEVEASVIESFSNKQHYGFLGHAYLGSWINIGAGTSNSDLKNTYGPVNFVHNGVKENSGMQFLGCIMGDYSKTAINTSIFTGKVIGASSLLYGFVTGNVPSFTNWAPSLGAVTKYNIDAAIKTQKRMFGRRKIEQTAAHVKLMRDVYEMTADEHGPYKDEPISF